MKVTLKNTTLIMVLIATFTIASCGNKGPRKGNALKGQDAMELLAGKTEKRWKLTIGDDFYKMMCFSKTGAFRDHSDFKMSFLLDGSRITLKDYKDVVFTIVEIDEKKMTLTSEKGEALIYEVTNDMPSVTEKPVAGTADKKWLIGASNGSVWKGFEVDYTYTFMNNGRFFDSNTGFKEEKWSWVDDKTIKIGGLKCKVVQLTALTLVIEMAGNTMQLNYAGEAGADGKLNAALK